MKIALSTYSLSQTNLNQVQMIQKIKDLGFDAVEVAELAPPEGISRKQWAEMIREELERTGMPICNMDISSNLLQEGEVEKICSEIDLAKILGAPNVRHDICWAPKENYKSYESRVPDLAAKCRQTAEYGASLGIVVTTENHGYYSQDSDRVEKLINAVNHPNFGALVDMGNFLCADEDPVTAVSRMAPYARHVHAKDFVFRSGMWDHPGEGFIKTRGGNFIKGTIVGHGVVPVRQCLQILKNAGYDGTVALEFEGMEDPMRAVQIGLDNLRRFMANIY